MHRFQRWRGILETAHTAAAVDRAVRDYAETLKPVMEALPADCRKAIEAGDVQAAAVTLLHCEMTYKGSAEVTQLLHEIAHTYAAASVRLSLIKSEHTLP